MAGGGGGLSVKTQLRQDRGVGIRIDDKRVKAKFFEWEILFQQKQKKCFQFFSKKNSSEKENADVKDSHGRSFILKEEICYQTTTTFKRKKDLPSVSGN